MTTPRRHARALSILLDRWIGFMHRHFGEPQVDGQVGQGRDSADRPAQRFSVVAPAVNVLLILALFAAVKLKLVFAAVVLAGLLGFAAWRAWA